MATEDKTKNNIIESFYLIVRKLYFLIPIVNFSVVDTDIDRTTKSIIRHPKRQEVATRDNFWFPVFN
jgi:hypothetical protein